MSTTRTAEGEPNICDVCGQKIRIEPSTFPDRDAPCPRCGCLLQFDDPKYASARVWFRDLPDCLERVVSMPRSPTLKRLVVDLKEFKFMTSAVLGKLISAHRKAQTRQIRLAVCNLAPDVAEVFRITKLDQLLEIVEA